MSKVAYSTVIEILLKIPNSSLVDRLCNETQVVINIDDVIIVFEKKRMPLEQLMDILDYQIGMSDWMIDYILGQNDIKP